MRRGRSRGPCDTTFGRRFGASIEFRLLPRLPQLLISRLRGLEEAEQELARTDLLLRALEPVEAIVLAPVLRSRGQGCSDGARRGPAYRTEAILVPEFEDCWGVDYAARDAALHHQIAFFRGRVVRRRGHSLYPPRLDSVWPTNEARLPDELVLVGFYRRASQSLIASPLSFDRSRHGSSQSVRPSGPLRMPNSRRQWN